MSTRETRSAGKGQGLEDIVGVCLWRSVVQSTRPCAAHVFLFLLDPVEYVPGRMSVHPTNDTVVTNISIVLPKELGVVRNMIRPCKSASCG